MNVTLKIWRQKSTKDAGSFETFKMTDVSPDSSFLEMLDLLNIRLEGEGKEPVAFESDCREGICGSCGLYINGVPHGPDKAITTCQLHMRRFNDGDEITVEPWRATAFPILKDLIVDREAFETIQQAGGYVSVNTGNAPDANALPVPKKAADLAFETATCIGCGACVAACKNASAMLFLSAKVTQYSLLPQGHPERVERVSKMLAAHDDAGFGNCTNEGECEAACPKEIKMENISRLNREFIRARVLTFLGQES